jgi:hypothetical protein
MVGPLFLFFVAAAWVVAIVAATLDAGILPVSCCVCVGGTTVFITALPAVGSSLSLLPTV